jgi:hypothetical protein
MPRSNDERLCTGDRIAIGASGPWIKQAIPSTDPANGGTNHLTASRTLYFDRGHLGVRGARLRDDESRHALTVKAVGGL